MKVKGGFRETNILICFYDAADKIEVNCSRTTMTIIVNVNRVISDYLRCLNKDSTTSNNTNERYNVVCTTTIIIQSWNFYAVINRRKIFSYFLMRARGKHEEYFVQERRFWEERISWRHCLNVCRIPSGSRVRTSPGAITFRHRRHLFPQNIFTLCNQREEIDPKVI